MLGARSDYSSGELEFLLGFAEAVAAEQEDLGVLDQAVGDRRGDGGVEEDVAPVGERGVGGDDSGTLLAVAVEMT